GRDIAFGIDLGQAVGHGAPERNLGRCIGVSGGIAGVGGGTMGEAEFGRAALFRRGRDTGLAQHRGGERRAYAQGRGPAHELTPADPPLDDLLCPIFEFAHWFSPCCVLPRQAAGKPMGATPQWVSRSLYNCFPPARTPALPLDIPCRVARI